MNLIIYNKKIPRKKKYFGIVLDEDCQTQGRLKLMIELYISEKSVINSNMYLINAPS
jgi:hypothetical protein